MLCRVGRAGKPGDFRTRTGDGPASDGECRRDPAALRGPQAIRSELGDHLEKRRPLPDGQDPEAARETPDTEFSVDDAHVLHHVSSGDHAAHRADQH